MVSWSTRRQFFYITGALLVFLFALALPVFFVTYKAPSCTDGLKNQGEQGIDCGGPCSLLCKANALDLIIHWQRAFKVKEGIYNVLAYIENPNLDSGVRDIPYTFKLYDEENLVIFEKRGHTFVPPKKVFGIFESNINTGTRVPARTFFEFPAVPVWTKDISPEVPLTFSNEILSGNDDKPRLTAVLENPGLNPVYNIEVVAVIYDLKNNALASSRTIVDSVVKGGSTPLVFTWPEPFASQTARIELLYRMLR